MQNNLIKEENGNKFVKVSLVCYNLVMNKNINIKIKSYYQR